MSDGDSWAGCRMSAGDSFLPIVIGHLASSVFSFAADSETGKSPRS